MKPHVYHWLLLTVFLSGCCTKHDKVTESPPHDSSNVVLAVRPIEFEASIGGFLGASYRVKLQKDGKILYQHHPQTFTSSPGTKSQTFGVTDDQWREFRQALEEANVWKWKKTYLNPDVLDGTSWSFKIKYPDASISSQGNNAFPDKRDFERFLEAVVMLLDGKAFQ